MKNVFGKATTKTNNNVTLSDAVLALSDKAVDLLVHLADMQESGNLDSRGVYVEYDKSECKPFATKDVNEVLKSGLVAVHEDSVYGTAFLFLNFDVVKVLVELGLFMPVNVKFS